MNKIKNTDPYGKKGDIFRDYDGNACSAHQLQNFVKSNSRKYTELSKVKSGSAPINHDAMDDKEKTPCFQYVLGKRDIPRKTRTIQRKIVSSYLFYGILNYISALLVGLVYEFL